MFEWEIPNGNGQIPFDSIFSLGGFTVCTAEGYEIKDYMVI